VSWLIGVAIPYLQKTIAGETRLTVHIVHITIDSRIVRSSILKPKYRVRGLLI